MQARITAARLAVFMLVSLAAGCEGGAGEPPEGRSFEEFMEASVTLPDGRIIADTDILFADVDDARAYFEAEMEASARRLDELDELDELERPDEPRFRLSVNLEGGSDDRWAIRDGLHLTYCVDTASFGANATALLEALDRATDSWHQRIGVSFRRVAATPCNNGNDEVTFNVRSFAMGANAVAFFPHEPRSVREILVSPGAFTTTAGGRDLEGILRHELGHTLGFRHEHIWLEPLCTVEGPANARPLTDYDEDSVMHYPQCRTQNAGGYRQTRLDYRGAIELYGLSPSLTTTLVL